MLLAAAAAVAAAAMPQCRSCTRDAREGKTKCAPCAESAGISKLKRRREELEAKSERGDLELWCAGCQAPVSSLQFAKSIHEHTKDDLCVGCEAAGVELKRCVECNKSKPVGTFAISQRECDKGARVSRCPPCNEKKRARDVVQAKTPAARAAQKLRRQGGVTKAARKRYREGAAGKAADKRYREGEAGQAARQRELKSDAKQRQRQSAKKDGSAKATQVRRRARIRADPGLWLSNRIGIDAVAVLRDKRKRMPSLLVAYTEFTTIASFVSHMQQRFAPGMDWSNYGQGPGKWQIEHGIPKWAFDFTIDADVKRCWSKANVRPMWYVENAHKSTNIDDAFTLGLGPAYFPEAWQGEMPTGKDKAALLKQMRAHKPLPVVPDESSDEEEEEVASDVASDGEDSDDESDVGDESD